MNHNIGPVGLNVGCNGAGTHMRVKTKDRVSDIIIVRNLTLVEKDDVFQFTGVADNAAFSDNRLSADERALPQLRSLINDTGAGNVRALVNVRVAGDPDILTAFFIDFFR